MDLDEILHLLAKRWGKEATAEEERDLRRWLREHPREAMWIRMMEAAGSPHRPDPPDDGARPWDRLRAATGSFAAPDAQEEEPKAQAA